ncbi:glycosyltransferase family 2 protein [Exiguobacterium sp. s138]|uniref:glycosyltransferase family 2 protein n=1 Tax=Exiguobacterium sp. s138 TaxID=2751202 RepID=UPI001BEA12CF|nr:glycosyltransferase family 2 protein [Exiguobacterium sp. s138]
MLFKICAVIVTYNPDLDVLKKLTESIGKQVSKIVIVDNGTKEDIRKVIKSTSNLEILLMNKNLGIAEAQNIAVKNNFDNEITHFIFFDQDSLPNSNLVSTLIKDSKVLIEKNINIGVIGPKFVDSRNNFTYSKSDVIEEKTLIISSGSLISKETFRKVGLMNKSFFIYHVDTEWCFRALNSGFRNFMSGNALMKHTIGENSKKIWFFKWINISIHSPKSHYYIVRNSLVMMSYKEIPFKWKIKYFLKNIFFVGFYIFLGENVKEYILEMYKGFNDGLRIIKQGGV